MKTADPAPSFASSGVQRGILRGLAAFLVLSSALTATAGGRGGGGGDHEHLRGRISGGIDAETREFTANVDHRRAVTVRVAEDAVLTKNGAPATFADLAEGDSFRAIGRTVSRRPLVFEARALGAFDGTSPPNGPPAHATGAIASIDAEAMTFVLRIGRRSDTIVAVNETTLIVKNGAEAGFDDLAVDDIASVRGRRERTEEGGDVLVALFVRANTKGTGGGRDRDGLQGRIEGGIDAEAREFTASSHRRDVTVRVAADARITRNGAAATFEDLAEGDLFRAIGRIVTAEPFVFEAMMLGAFDGSTPPRGPRDHEAGTIASIDADALTFVLAAGRAGATTVAVTESTMIVKDGAPADFAALAVGDRASARGRRERTDDGGTVLRAEFVRAASPGDRE